MAKLLYLQASPIGGVSRSRETADCFVAEYRRSHAAKELARKMAVSF